MVTHEAATTIYTHAGPEIGVPPPRPLPTADSAVPVRGLSWSLTRYTLTGAGQTPAERIDADPRQTRNHPDPLAIPSSSPCGSVRSSAKTGSSTPNQPFGGPDYVLQYLGRYTHRVAISNHRLVALADGQVTFRWRDSADHNQWKLMTLPVDEFLRRFLLHLLPKGFVRIRQCGVLAKRRRALLLPLCFAALHSVPP